MNLGNLLCFLLGEITQRVKLDTCKERERKGNDYSMLSGSKISASYVAVNSTSYLDYFDSKKGKDQL